MRWGSRSGYALKTTRIQGEDRYANPLVYALGALSAALAAALLWVLARRGAPPALVDAADTVTDMSLVKHAFQAGVRAQQGIEW